MADAMAGLPPLYAGWMAELLAGPIPEEREATCSSCPMCGVGDGGISFDSRTKCCTFLPSMPNFLVGAVLSDADPAAAAGRASVLARLQRGVGVTPLGIHSSRHHAVLYEAGRRQLFGRSLSLRCPHYLEEQGGACGIWRHRSSVCATWFCKHVRGAVGMRFWHAMQQLLDTVERTLATWCVLALDPGTAALELLFPPPQRRSDRPLEAADLEGRPPPDYAALWGSWSEREIDLYLACAQRVAPLSFREVIDIGGPELALHAHILRHAHAALLSDALPARVRAASYRTVRAGRDTVRLRTYSDYDPIELPRALIDILPQFDGSPTSEALQRIADDGVEIEPALVRRLIDFALLEQVPSDLDPASSADRDRSDP